MLGRKSVVLCPSDQRRELTLAGAGEEHKFSIRNIGPGGPSSGPSSGPVQWQLMSVIDRGSG